MGNKTNKGTYLELRIARLLLSQNVAPFVNVWFRTGIEHSSISQPDIDVMGCVFLPECTNFYIYYDCKSGDSKVINRILMLSGLRGKIPPGPITYIRRKTALSIKQYALQNGIKITNLKQIEEKEKKFVHPLFKDHFPSVSDIDVHELWLSTKGKNKKNRIGNILNYLEYDFWGEKPFTRLKRTLAALQLFESTIRETNLTQIEKDILICLILRKLIFSILDAASYLSLLSKDEILLFVRDSLISENIEPLEYQKIIESTAQFIYELYGDSSKGPLRKEDYYIPPPDYTEELISLLQRTIDLGYALPWILLGFDGLVFEKNVRNRDEVASYILTLIDSRYMADIKSWFRSIKLFLENRNNTLKKWRGWKDL
ncbi:MAG TPA: hypothetical protein ENG48_01880 [Candidatus Atribacteria bacterium]|nr:hypothetical protein [Candidatus Atribacteria bacterium]